MTELSSHAEKMAQVATNFASMPINLLETKRTVEEILSQFGRNSIFSEYTLHDISHINDMLETASWIIPAQTSEQLSPADWLMIVLSIYFHDLGLVVTESEFDNRARSEFPSFVARQMADVEGNEDFRSKVLSLSEERQERFLYQEFVRHNHGTRVRAWLEGKLNPDFGYANSVVEEIEKLFSKVDRDFRRDLAAICESHNLDDLDNTSKYRLAQPYGNTDQETANLQYAAAILRTVDLIQITNRRAPSVSYRLIDPKDPISQVEWQKQNGVKRVRARPAVDRDGNATLDIQSDTISVVASFASEVGFFGLTTYLHYAADQLAATYAAIQKSRRKTPKKYEFPWRYVDDSEVGADGYLKQTFGFVIDQEKILELLTGHTLYNDSRVVLRELVQNSLDAVRLQAHMSSTPLAPGEVRVTWRGDLHELSVVDNGTGMTQEVVESHLLKVGSSRYRDPKFREMYPNFSPISRFGIGILSTFMIADSVEIITVSEHEEQARRISLRSVHGKYLIRLLDKSDEAVKAIGPHGTAVKLTLRASADDPDALATMRRWIRIPRCSVLVCIDDAAPEVVGYESAKAALEAVLGESTRKRWLAADSLRVVEETLDGLTLAYAQVYNEHLRDWGLLDVDDLVSLESGEEDIRFATCVEGVAVEFKQPGYAQARVVCFGDATGLSAPKTDVARTSLELTTEKENMARSAYTILFAGVVREASRLVAEEGYSLTWAAEQIPFLLGPALDESGRQEYYSNRNPSVAEFGDAYRSALSKVPMFLVEREGKREKLSLKDLSDIGEFWTVESPLSDSVAELIREARREITSAEMMKVGLGNDISLPPGPILVNKAHSSNVVTEQVMLTFQVVGMVSHEQQRRLDMNWKLGNDGWISRSTLASTLSGRNAAAYNSYLRENEGRFSRGARSFSDVLVPTTAIATSGLEKYFAVSSYNRMHILPKNGLRSSFQKIFQDADQRYATQRALVLFDLASWLTTRLDYDIEESVTDFFETLEGKLPDQWLTDENLVLGELKRDPLPRALYEPTAWGRDYRYGRYYY